MIYHATWQNKIDWSCLYDSQVNVERTLDPVISVEETLGVQIAAVKLDFV